MFFYGYLSELAPRNTASFFLYICGSIVTIRERLINHLSNWNTPPCAGWLITIFYNFPQKYKLWNNISTYKTTFLPLFGLIPVYRGNIKQDMILILRLHGNFNTAVCVWVCVHMCAGVNELFSEKFVHGAKWFCSSTSSSAQHIRPPICLHCVKCGCMGAIQALSHTRTGTLAHSQGLTDL